MIQQVLIFLVLMVFVVSVQAQKKSVSHREMVISMDGLEVHRLKNPTSVRSLDKSIYKSQSNNLVIDLSINLEDRGIKKNITRCVDDMIQKSKTDSTLNSYSVEALGLICANYERQNRSGKNGIAQYFEGGFILHEGPIEEKSEGLLILNGAENKLESIASLNGLLLSKIDRNIEKNELNEKYCTSASGYTSAVCMEIGCGSFKRQIEGNTWTQNYKFTSCENASCKGFPGDKFRQEVIGTTPPGDNEKSQKMLKLFGDTFLKYRLRESMADDACIACPSNYSFDGVQCVDANGCNIFERFEQGVCSACDNEKEFAITGSCVNSCKSDCQYQIGSLETQLKNESSLKLSDLFFIAAKMVNADEVSKWEKANPNDANKLKIQLRAAAENYLQKLKTEKKCKREDCSFSQEMLKVINSYNFCGDGNTYAFGKCIKSQCVECENAKKNFSLYERSSYQRIKCGSQNDQLQIYSFLLENARSEYRERALLCKEGRVDICRDFQPIKEEDVRNIAQRIGIDCSRSPKSFVPAKGKH